MINYLLIAAGGGLGSLIRYVVGTAIMQRYLGRFPMGTFVINVTGSFLIGVAMTLLTERFAPHTNLRMFLVIGFLGGYTTFSSFEYESLQSVRGGAPWLALVYVLSSVIVGYFGVWLGVVVASRR